LERGRRKSASFARERASQEPAAVLRSQEC